MACACHHRSWTRARHRPHHRVSLLLRQPGPVRQVRLSPGVHPAAASQLSVHPCRRAPLGRGRRRRSRAAAATEPGRAHHHGGCRLRRPVRRLFQRPAIHPGVDDGLAALHVSRRRDPAGSPALWRVVGPHQSGSGRRRVSRHDAGRRCAVARGGASRDPARPRLRRPATRGIFSLAAGCWSGFRPSPRRRRS